MEDFVHVDEMTVDDSPNPTPSNKRNTPQLQEPSNIDEEILNMHPFVKQSFLDKVYGCILGSALGDTVGLYTEFLPKSACEDIYKERKFSLVEPVTEWYSDSHRNRFEPCAWTDDTDQALLIILSYLDNRGSSKGLANLQQDFALRLRIWIEQGLLALGRPPCGIGAMVGGVVSNSKYLEDPEGIATERWIKSARHGAPNGSLMRTHPIGVMCAGLSEEEAWKIATAVGRTTHVDPRCVVSCCISVGLIRGMLRGEILDEEDVDNAIERAYAWVHGQPELMNPGLATELTTWEIERHLDRKELERHVYAKEFGELKLDDRKEMGYVYKCLGSAVLTLRLGIRATPKDSVAPNTLFEKLMTGLIMEGGDSDTNGAAAGALLGAYLGYSRLPAHWGNGLAHREWLMSKIKRMTIVAKFVQGPLNAEKDEAPDGGKGLMSREELEKRDRDMLYLILTRDKERKEKEQRKQNKGKGLTSWFTK